jgi:hypothetical protein
MALYLAVVEIVWLRLLLEEIGFPQYDPSEVQQDNLSTIRIMTRRPGWGGRSKMFELKYFWVTETIDRNWIKLVKVDGETIHADGLTKPRDARLYGEWEDRMLGKADKCD